MLIELLYHGLLTIINSGGLIDCSNLNSYQRLFFRLHCTDSILVVRHIYA